MEFLRIFNPQWATENHTAINVIVIEKKLGELPFTATPNDSTDYGPEIFEQALQGKYGEIAPYVPPPDAEIARRERSERDRRLRMEYDPQASRLTRDLRLTSDSVMIEALQNELAQWDSYAVALQDVPQQAGFPHTIIWPEAPANEITHY